MSEWLAGVEMHRIAYDQWKPIRESEAAPSGIPNLSPLARTNRSGVPDSEFRLALSGDRRAQSQISLLEAETAAERARGGVAWLKQAAAQDYVLAEYQLAVRLLGFTGWRIIPLDNAEGVRLLRKAANGGHPNAQLAWGEMLIAGTAVPVDLSAGMGFLRQAADQGLPRAQCALAEQYAVGNGEPRHPGETPVALFRKAAETGLPDAQFALAERYRTGLGVAPDHFEAIAWYRRAAASNQLGQVTASVSARRMATLLKAGDLVESANDLGDPQFVESLRVHFKAVNLRDAAAQSSIGDYYAHNQVAEHAAAKACFWYGLAGAQGLQRAAEKHAELKRSLTEADSQRLARWTMEFDRSKP
jgi:TPR repeat protein